MARPHGTKYIGTKVTSESIADLFQDMFDRMPNSISESPKINYEDAKKLDELMRKARFDQK